MQSTPAAAQSVVPKALVVNGLPRSGTTMLERLIDSQPEMTCFTMAFPMVSLIAELRGLGAKEKIMTESFTEGRNVVTERSHHILRSMMATSFLSHYFTARRISGANRPAAGIDAGSGETLVYGLSYEQFAELLGIVLRYPDITDLAGLLRAMGERLGARVVGTRWTAHHRYAPVFLRNPDAYWIEIVRNPYARFSSVRIIQSAESLANVFAQMQDCLDFATTFRHDRYLMVRYEDACENPERVLAEISDWIGVRIDDVDLVNPLGGPFRPNTTESVSEGKDLYHQSEALAARIGAVDLDGWRQRLSETEIAIVNRGLDFRGLYEKEQVGPKAAAAASRAYARLRLLTAAKRVVKAAIGRTGFTVHRQPAEHPL